MITPTQEHRRTQLHVPREMTKGLDAQLEAWIGGYRRRSAVLDALLVEAALIDELAPTYAHLSDRHLQNRLKSFQEIFQRYSHPNSRAVQHGLAALREAAERKLGLRPFDVQLAGALALYRGFLAEMATGEGKTLTAGLAGALGGWTKRPCHIITVNDYLAQRDAEWMGALYRFSGVSVGYITGAMEADARRAAYGQGVTYCTGKEIVADFLRDRLRLGHLQQGLQRQIQLLLRPRLVQRMGLVMRGLGTAIVDEADSVLVDEAVTPVLISRPHKNPVLQEACRVAAEITVALEPGWDYALNPRYREIEIHPAGEEKLDQLCGELPGFWRGSARRDELIRQALTAREFFQEGKQYVIQDGKVVIVDESTGRIMPQRTWREGLHQAIEAKEGLLISDPSETMARISFQRFFLFFAKRSGMTGTAQEAADEFWHIYKLPVIPIPPNRPCLRKDLPDQVFPDVASKWDAVVEEVIRIHVTGRPVLVGTRSVTASELLSSRLAERGMKHNVLNAVRIREEAQIVAGAGLPGHITIATNMAGRGTDIKLGTGVAELGGLHVLATERHESRRIDRQLFGRSGRQGDPGSAQTFVSIEDELLRRFLPGWIRRGLESAFKTNGLARQRIAGTAFARAQHAAQRQGRKQRRTVLKVDTWMKDSLSFAGQEYVD